MLRDDGILFTFLPTSIEPRRAVFLRRDGGVSVAECRTAFTRPFDRPLEATQRVQGPGEFLMTVFLFWDGGVAYRGAAGIGGAGAARSGGSAERDQRNGAGGRNPGKPTHRARGLLLQNVCITKKVPQKKKEN